MEELGNRIDRQPDHSTDYTEPITDKTALAPVILPPANPLERNSMRFLSGALSKTTYVER
jgi:hypothetical protein